MNTWDNKKARKIIEVLQQNKQGIGFRKLSRESGISRGGLEVWLKRLRELSMVKDEPRIPIRLTEEALEKCKKNTLVIPCDPRSKKNKLNDREHKIILLILSIGAFGYFKWNRVYQDRSDTNSKVESLTNKDFMYYGGKRIPGVAIEDIIFYHENKDGSLKLRTSILEDQINVTNMRLFGYLELTENKAEKYIKYLTTDCDTPILIESKCHNQTRYVIQDKELKEFIKICVILFCQDVYPILDYFYSLNESILKAREKKELEYFERFPSSYLNISKGELIAKNKRFKKLLKASPYYKNRLKRKPEQNSKDYPDQIKKYEEYMRATWFGENRTSLYFNYMKSGILADNTHSIKEAIKDIYKCNIFDDDLEGINKKYKVLQERYPEIVEAILETLFPRFFRDVIREQYMKNITR